MDTIPFSFYYIVFSKLGLICNIIVTIIHVDKRIPTENQWGGFSTADNALFQDDAGIKRFFAGLDGGICLLAALVEFKALAEANLCAGFVLFNDIPEFAPDRWFIPGNASRNHFHQSDGLGDEIIQRKELQDGVQ